jgi:hypothetical protein
MKGPIIYSRLKQERPALVAAVEHLFGSWRVGAGKAGIQVESGRNLPRKWTPASILAVLKKARRMGKVRVHLLQGRYPGLYNGAVREFGTWSTALELAGVRTSEIASRRFGSSRTHH